jgi:putative tryptophan/tyrosine transport system substrate-binding protein
MGGKWLEVLKETAPHLTRIMTIFHPETRIQQAFWHSVQAAAPRFGVEVSPAGVHDSAEIESAISSFAMKQNGGVIVPPHAITWANDDLIIALALRHRLPAVFSTDGSVTAGGLVSYGYNLEQTFRKTADYVDRILRGEKPSDLPVQQPTKFKLVFNLKTAKALDPRVGPAARRRADRMMGWMAPLRHLGAKVLVVRDDQRTGSHPWVRLQQSD